MKVLHITPWYPSVNNSLEGLWVRRHILSIQEKVNQQVIHIDIRGGKKLSYKKVCSSRWESHYFCQIPTKRWFFIEVTWFFLLGYLFVFKRLHKRFDVIQFHIAYPALIYWYLLKRVVRIPVVVLEHWSAFHFNFGISNEKKLYRIKRIFSQGIPIMAVSQALINDITLFSKNKLKTFILPNIVDTGIFFPKRNGVPIKSRILFMVSQWNWPKEPLLAINAFVSWNMNQKLKFVLRIGGYGNLWNEMIELVEKLNVKKEVVFLGRLSADEIAKEMNNAYAFVHPTGYETFSVVCAEALCCGTPVLGSAVGGLKEFVNAGNGILVQTNTVQNWIEALNQLLTKRFDNFHFAEEAKNKFSPEVVGLRYFQFLHSIVYGDH